MQGLSLPVSRQTVLGRRLRGEDSRCHLFRVSCGTLDDLVLCGPVSADV